MTGPAPSCFGPPAQPLRWTRPRGPSACRALAKGLFRMGSVVKKRRKRMAKKKHRKLLRRTRIQRRRLGK